jgi:hypothetical protein
MTIVSIIDTFPLWPPTLPQFPLLEGYGEALAQLTVDTPADIGPMMSRRRGMSGLRPQYHNFYFNTAQLLTFESFYYVTLSGGSLPFRRLHPRLLVMKAFKIRTDNEMRFGAEGTAGQGGNLYKIPVNLMQLPYV